MALVLGDRIRDTTTTTGTGSATLSGTAPSGFQNFSKVGNGNTTYYTIAAGSEWEVGIGTYSSTGPTLSRDTILDSSNSGSLVNFSAGTKDVFVTYPAERVTSGTVTSVSGTGTVSGLTLSGSVTGSGSLTLGGTLSLTSGNVTTALGYTPYNGATNPNGYLSSITSGNVTTALGYTPANQAGDTFTGPVTLATTNRSSAAWTTSGINLIQSAATFTDTTSTGTVANVYINAFNAQTMAASSTTTVTNLVGAYFASPVAGTNVTATSRYALAADSINCYNTLAVGGSLALIGSTGTVTNQFGTAVTASGSTKTVNIGTGGASGSTTAITIGSNGGTSTAVFNGNVGVGSAGTTAGFTNTKNVTGGTAAYANYTNATIQSDVTSQGYGFHSQLSTAAAAFTLSNLFHYRAQQGSFGSGSTINNQYSFYSSAQNIDATANNGFYAEDTAAVTTGKTSYGFRSAINIATGGGTTYQLFMGGTAQNVIKGTVTFSGANFSQAAWTTNGVGLIQAATTYTDTTSTGTVANVRMNNFAAQTLAASNAVTYTNAYGNYFTSPAAGTNVTIGNPYAVGTDSLHVVGTGYFGGAGVLNAVGIIALTGTTATNTANYSTAVTSSGATKTVNIGTNGASGSTTNITLGSATSGATQTTTINGRVTLAPIGASAAAWTTSGIALTQSAATWTDTSSTGTVADVRMNMFGAQTLAATNPITATRLYGAYFSAPVAGTNVSVTSSFAVGIAGNAEITGSLIGTGPINLVGPSTTTTGGLLYGTTASGNTKTVNIGTGGASGSTTNITIGSSTSGATSTLTLEGTMSDPAIIYANSPGFRGLPQNAKTGAYTLALTDAGKHISITTGGITVPANGSVAFPIGTTIVIYNDSASSQNIAITTDTMYLAGTATTGTRALAQRGLATLVKVAATTWVCSGPGVT